MKVSLEINWTFFLQFCSQGIVQVSVEALCSKYDVGGHNSEDRLVVTLRREEILRTILCGSLYHINNILLHATRALISQNL